MTTSDLLCAPRSSAETLSDPGIDLSSCPPLRGLREDDRNNRLIRTIENWSLWSCGYVLIDRRLRGSDYAVRCYWSEIAYHDVVGALGGAKTRHVCNPNFSICLTAGS